MSKHVVCAGIICLDIVNTLSQPAVMGGKQTGCGLLQSPGGIIKNTAEVLARMGEAVSLISAAGYDSFSQAAVNGCKSAGIDTSHIRLVQGGSVVTCIQVVQPNGDLVIMTGTAIDPNSQVAIEQVKQAHDLIDSAGALMLCPSLSDEVIDYLVAAYPHIPLFADVGAAVNRDKFAPYLKYLHTFKVNLREAEAFCGFSIKTQEDLKRAAAYFLNEGVQNIAITLGEDGAVYANSERFAVYPARPAEKVVNTAGAGDSFLAGLIFGHINGLDTDTSVAIASACARLSIQSMHTINPDIDLTSVLKEAGFDQSILQ